MKSAMKILGISLVLAGCGAKAGGETGSSAAATSSESIFKDWALTIPQADATTFANWAEVGSNPFVSNGYETSFDDIVNNRRLNLSQLKSGKNILSTKNWGGCDYRAEFSISVYLSGEIIFSRKRTWQSSNAACGPTRVETDSLYYKYSITAGRLTVCGYDDANYTLLRGCVTSQ